MNPRDTHCGSREAPKGGPIPRRAWPRSPGSADAALGGRTTTAAHRAGPGISPLPRTRLRSFGGLHESFSELHRPESIEELRQLLAGAERERRRVAFRAGGQSLDGQALSGDLSISLERLDAIEVDVDRLEVTVGAGAKWGTILARLPPGLVPHVMVTTSVATAGGTLSSDAHSRFSPAFGRESEHVKRFDLMTADGRLLCCTRDNEHRELFSCAMGGMGYLGVVTRITYELLDLRHLLARAAPHDRALCVETIAHKYVSYRDLVSDLLPAIRDSKERHDTALYAVILPHGRGILHRSRYVPPERLKPLPAHDLDNPLRTLIEWALRSSTLNELGWRLIYSLYYRNERRFIDDLFNYTFFMDGTRRAKEAASRLGVELNTIQQTFIVPINLQYPSETVETTARILTLMMDRLLGADLPPLICDALYLPMKEDLYAASSRDASGVAVTLAFAVTSLATAERVRRHLEHFSREIVAVGGRVHLTKNVHARTEDLRTMYGDALAGFLGVKRRVDPAGILRNEFLERIFPGAVT
jgi:decaprenylphospho-beta-D-ribofuranose 2-oxidase